MYITSFHHLIYLILIFSDFCNGAQRHKVVRTVQTMNEYFERPFLIIEMMEEAKHRTKYLDMIMAQLAQSNICVLYSTSHKETASIMSILATKESKKGFALPENLKLPLLSEKFMPFYLSLPATNFALALQMALTFKAPAELVLAAQATLQRRLKLDEKRAKKLHSYLRSFFQHDMTLKG